MYVVVYLNNEKKKNQDMEFKLFALCQQALGIMRAMNIKKVKNAKSLFKTIN